MASNHWISDGYYGLKKYGYMIVQKNPARASMGLCTFDTKEHSDSSVEQMASDYSDLSLMIGADDFRPAVPAMQAAFLNSLDTQSGWPNLIGWYSKSGQSVCTLAYAGYAKPATDAWCRLAPCFSGQALYLVGKAGSISCAGDGPTFTVSFDGHIYLLADGATSAGDARPIMDVSSVVVTNTGIMRLVGTPAPAFGDFGIGFRHRIVPFSKSSETGPGRTVQHPLLDSTCLAAGQHVTLSLDPLQQQQTDFLQFSDTVLKTTLRTSVGDPIYIAGVDEKSFTWAPDGDGGQYLTPSGKHTVRVGPGGLKKPSRLMLAFTCTDTVEIADGDALTFDLAHTESPLLAEKADGELVPASLTKPMKTAWVSLTPAADRQWRYFSADMPLYTLNPSRPSDPRPAHVVAQATLKAGVASKAFPLLPAVGLPPPDPDVPIAHDPFVIFENRYATPLRNDKLEQSGGSVDTGKFAVTRDGWVAQFASGRMSDLVLAQLESTNANGKVHFSAAGGQVPEKVLDALFSPNCFVVATVATDVLKTSYSGFAEFDGLTFDLGLPPPGNPPPTGPRALIVKFGTGSIKERLSDRTTWTGISDFNDVSKDPDGAQTASWLLDYINTAENDLARGRTALTEFVDAVNDSAWTGFLFLGAPLTAGKGVPVEGADIVAVLANNAELAAHHIGCRVSGIMNESTTPEPNSSFFGLLHYVNPKFAAADPLALVPDEPDFDCVLASMEVVIDHNTLTDFHCSLYLVMNKLFGQTVAWMSPDATLPPSNSIVIRGALQTHGGEPAFVFAADQTLQRAFYPIDGAIRMLQPGTVGLRTTANAGLCFSISGWFSTVSGLKCDIASYAGISFGGLVLWAKPWPPNPPNPPKPGYDCSLDISALKLGGVPERRLPDGSEASGAAVAANSLYRPGSLAQQFPLSVGRMRTGPPGDHPSDHAYSKIDVPEPGAECKWDQGWYGLEFDLPLAGNSTTADALISGRLLLAWPVSSPLTDIDSSTLTPHFRLEGPTGVSLGLQIAGVITVGANSVELKQADDTGTFTLKLASIGLTVLGKTFPPKGSTNITISKMEGTDERSLGWFASYRTQESAP